MWSASGVEFSPSPSPDPPDGPKRARHRLVAGSSPADPTAVRAWQRCHHPTNAPINTSTSETSPTPPVHASRRRAPLRHSAWYRSNWSPGRSRSSRAAATGCPHDTLATGTGNSDRTALPATPSAPMQMTTADHGPPRRHARTAEAAKITIDTAATPARTHGQRPASPGTQLSQPRTITPIRPVTCRAAIGRATLPAWGRRADRRPTGRRRRCAPALPLPTRRLSRRRAPRPSRDRRHPTHPLWTDSTSRRRRVPTPYRPAQRCRCTRPGGPSQPRLQ